MNMEITFPGNQRVEASYKGFRIATDQPIEHGGDESAPSPFDLFLAAIGTGMGHYARSFCAARNLATDGMSLRLHFEHDATGRRIEVVRVEIRLPDDFPAKYRDALRSAIGTCAVKRALEAPPRFGYEVVGEPLGLKLH